MDNTIKADLERAKELMEKNLEFLKQEYPTLLEELEGFEAYVNEVVGYLPKFSYVRNDCLPFTFILLVLPFAYYVKHMLLLGSVPLASYALRTILEAVELAVHADLSKLRERPLGERVEALRRTRPSEVVGSSLRNAFVKVFPQEAEEIKGILEDLHQALSAFLHPFAEVRFKDLGEEYGAGIVKAVLKTVGSTGKLPSYAYYPFFYGRHDLEDLKYFHECLRTTRETMDRLIRTWAKLKGLPEGP